MTKNTSKKSQPLSDSSDSQNVETAPKSKKSSVSHEAQTMDELLTQTGYALKGWRKGDSIKAVISSVSPRHVLLDIGGKSEAVVHEKELPYVSDLLGSLKAGDTLDVHVVNPENDRGQTVVSLRKTAFAKRWEMLSEKMKAAEAIEVSIRELSKGGFLVDYMGLRGFIPLSQVQPELTKLGDRATGRRVTVKVIEIDKDLNRLVFSQIAGGISEKQNDALKKVEIGGIYKAEVTGIAPFGAFVTVKIDDVNLPGLIHISEIAWEKVEDPNHYLKIGQTPEVKVLGADPKIGKLTLSIKQLLPDPWQDVTKVLSTDQTVKGKVTRITQYGAFISLLPGIEGLVHVSKYAPGEEPKAGQDVECLIEQIDADKRKISLSFITHSKPIGYR